MNEQRKALGFLEDPPKLDEDWDKMLNRLYDLIKTANNPNAFRAILLSVKTQKPSKKILRATLTRIDAEYAKENSTNAAIQRAR